MSAPEEKRGNAVPAKLGYRFPAEWEPHAATWISWPHAEGFSFPGAYERVLPAFVRMVEALAKSEPVFINVKDAEQEELVRKLVAKVDPAHVRFHRIATDEPWCRDHGPTFLTRKGAAGLGAVKWRFNAWGYKYAPFEKDDEAGIAMAEVAGAEMHQPDMVLEGGAIETNGRGTILTTRSCLLNPNRNPGLTQKEIEARLRDYLGARKVLWLGDGIEGDDTDGHIDDITRFVDHDRVVTCVEEDPEDPNHAPLRENRALLAEMKTADGDPLEIIDLPMPPRITRQGQRLPASYANFYIANRVILLPAYADPADQWAATILQHAFPDLEVIPIDCRELIWGLGAFHCLTQQVPLPSA